MANVCENVNLREDDDRVSCTNVKSWVSGFVEDNVHLQKKQDTLQAYHEKGWHREQTLFSVNDEKRSSSITQDINDKQFHLAPLRQDN